MFAYVRRRLGEAAAHIARRSRARDRGQALVEYAFVLIFIAMVVVLILVVLGHQVNNVYSNISRGVSQ